MGRGRHPAAGALPPQQRLRNVSCRDNRTRVALPNTIGLQNIRSMTPQLRNHCRSVRRCGKRLREWFASPKEPCVLGWRREDAGQASRPVSTCDSPSQSARALTSLPTALTGDLADERGSRMNTASVATPHATGSPPPGPRTKQAMVPTSREPGYGPGGRGLQGVATEIDPDNFSDVLPCPAASASARGPESNLTTARASGNRPSEPGPQPNCPDPRRIPANGLPLSCNRLRLGTQGNPVRSGVWRRTRVDSGSQKAATSRRLRPIVWAVPLDLAMVAGNALARGSAAARTPPRAKQAGRQPGRRGSVIINLDCVQSAHDKPHPNHPAHCQ